MRTLKIVSLAIGGPLVLLFVMGLVLQLAGYEPSSPSPMTQEEKSYSHCVSWAMTGNYLTQQQRGDWFPSFNTDEARRWCRNHPEVWR